MATDGEGDSGGEGGSGLVAVTVAGATGAVPFRAAETVAMARAAVARVGLVRVVVVATAAAAVRVAACVATIPTHRCPLLTLLQDETQRRLHQQHTAQQKKTKYALELSER